MGDSKHDESNTEIHQDVVNGTAVADVAQLRGLINERNTYCSLLQECLYALNQIPNTAVAISTGSEQVSTYSIAAKIGAVFRKFDPTI